MDTFFDSVARAFEGNRQALPQVQLVILVLLALLVVLQPAGLVRRLLARRSRFQQLLATRGVSADDRRFARRLAARAEVEPLRSSPSSTCSSGPPPRPSLPKRPRMPPPPRLESGASATRWAMTGSPRIRRSCPRASSLEARRSTSRRTLAR